VNEIKLLPCPFCDNEVEYHPASHHMNNFWNKNTIYCPTCDFMMEGSSTVHLVKRWNTRKPMERVIEKLKEARAECKELQRSTTDAYGYMKMKQGIDCAMDIVKEEGGIECQILKN
jgi:hypothetical protein